MQNGQKWHIFVQKMSKNYFFKKAAQRLWNTLQGMSSPNFSSKASVAFSNSAGRHEKRKCLKRPKTPKNSTFSRKIACFNCPCYGKYCNMQLKYFTIGMIHKNYQQFWVTIAIIFRSTSLKMAQNLLRF